MSKTSLEIPILNNMCAGCFIVVIRCAYDRIKLLKLFLFTVKKIVLPDNRDKAVIRKCVRSLLCTPMENMK